MGKLKAGYKSAGKDTKIKQETDKGVRQSALFGIDWTLIGSRVDLVLKESASYYEACM